MENNKPKQKKLSEYQPTTDELFFVLRGTNVMEV